MSQLGSQPATAGSGAVASSSSNPVIPPPRISSREPLASGNDAAVSMPDSSPAQAAPPATAPAPDASHPSELHGSPASPKTESLGRSAKRSLTNLRRRDRSTASKQSNQQQSEPNEKETIPSSAGRTGGPAGSARTKKRSGIWAILVCCSPPDDNAQDEAAQPAKVPVRTQPARISQPTQTRQQQQDATPLGPNANEFNDEVVDEKAEQPPYQDELAAPAEMPSYDASKRPLGDATLDKPVPSLPSETPPVQPNAEIRPVHDDTQAPIPEEPATGPPHIDTAVEAPEAEHASSQAAPLIVPLPAAAAIQPEDEILDRTPEQAARDNDIEMKDAGPSIPLSATDAAIVVEEERQAHEQREAAEAKQDTLPLPPPVQNGQEQPAQDVVAVNQATSLAASPEPPQKFLLPPLSAELRGRKCLVLDLDETLVHSSFKIFHQADFTLPIEIEGQYHNVYVIKRPGVDAFLKRVGELYEIVVFTASVSKYGDPVLDHLDIHHVVHHRLFRDSCYNHQGNYVKDLSQIGRDLRETIIIDNSPTSYIFHPQHAVPISSWFSDAHDNELLDLIPVLEDLAGSQVADVSLVLDVAL